MNYELELSKSNPAVFNNLNGTTPPLVAGSGSASLLSADTTETFWAFVAGREAAPFTLEVWYLPVSFSGTGEVAVIGHTDEGLLYNGTSFILRVRTTTEVFEKTWTPQEIKASHYVVVYDGSTVTLYVDGTDVLFLEIPAFSTFASSDTNIGLNNPINASATGVYDSLALYYRALTAEEINQHYAWGRDALLSQQIATFKGGDAYSLSFDEVDVLQTITFYSNNWLDWSMSGIYGVDPLTAEPGGGTWTASIPIGSIVDSLSGIYVSWVSQGAIFEYSTDFVTWTTLINRSTILEDSDVDDLYIRITLPDVEAWAEQLSLTIIGERTLQPLSGPRRLTFKSASMDEASGHQLDYQLDAGATIRDGYIQVEPHVPAAEEVETTISSVEFWARVDSTSGTVLVQGSNSIVATADGLDTELTVYRDGQVLSNATTPGWHHYVVVLPSAVNAAIRLGNNMAGDDPVDMNVGHLAVYSETLTENQALSLYKYNVGAPAIQITDSGSMNVSESSPATDIYAYAWSRASG